MALKRSHIYLNLSRMVESAVPLRRSLETAVSGSSGGVYAAFERLAGEVDKGRPLHEAMAEERHYFSDFELTMIELGTVSGSLENSFAQLSHWFEQKEQARAKIQSALILPILTLHLAAVISAVPALIIGKGGMGQFALSVGSTLVGFYFVAILIVACLRSGNPLAQHGRVLFEKLPVLGGLLLSLDLSVFCRAYVALADAGVAIREALPMLKSLCRTRAMVEQVNQAHLLAEAGSPIGSAWRAPLPMAFISSWQSAEVSGQLSVTMARLAEQMRDEADRRLAALAQWLPRVAYVAVALVVIKNIFTLASGAFGHLGL